jgi:hypothetical protein
LKLTGLAYFGGGSVISESACIRNNATRQLIFLSVPLVRRKENSSQTWRNSRRRLGAGLAAIRARMRSISAAMKVRAQYRMAQLELIRPARRVARSAITVS